MRPGNSPSDNTGNKKTAAAVAKIPGPNNEISKRQITECPHTDRKYYAKGMCANCYHRRGRSKKAWACPHPRKTHYSKGLCKYCYLSNYYKSRTAKGGRIPASKMPTEKMLKELADNSNSEDLERLLNQDEPMNQADSNSDSQPLQGNLTQEDNGKIASKQQNCTLKEAETDAGAKLTEAKLS